MSNVTFFGAVDTEGRYIYVGGYALSAIHEIKDQARVQVDLVNGTSVFLNLSFDEALSKINAIPYVGLLQYTEANSGKRIAVAQYQVLAARDMGNGILRLTLFGSGSIDVLGSADDYNNNVTNNLY